MKTRLYQFIRDGEVLKYEWLTAAQVTDANRYAEAFGDSGRWRTMSMTTTPYGVSVWRFDERGWRLDPVARFASPVDAQEYLETHEWCIITDLPDLTITDVERSRGRTRITGSFGGQPQVAIEAMGRAVRAKSSCDPKWLEAVMSLSDILGQQAGESGLDTMQAKLDGIRSLSTRLRKLTE